MPSLKEARQELQLSRDSHVGKQWCTETVGVVPLECRKRGRILCREFRNNIKTNEKSVCFLLLPCTGNSEKLSVIKYSFPWMAHSHFLSHPSYRYKPVLWSQASCVERERLGQPPALQTSQPKHQAHEKRSHCGCPAQSGFQKTPAPCCLLTEIAWQIKSHNHQVEPSQTTEL